MAIFMKVPGIRGAATASGHKGDIELVALNVDGKDSSQADYTAGLRSDNLTVVKNADSTSNRLLMAAGSGEILGEVVISLVSRGRTEQFNLEFVTIKAFTTSAAKENITFACTKWTHTRGNTSQAKPSLSWQSLKPVRN